MEQESAMWRNSLTPQQRQINVVQLASNLLIVLPSVWLVMIRALLSDGRTAELNTPLESSWSTKLKSITFDPNRAIFDEQEQVIDLAARSVNRFL